MQRNGRNTHYCCPVEAALAIIGGKWKPLLLWMLTDGTKRFSEIQHAVPNITQTMLTKQLRELEHDRLISRKVYAEVPPKVEYSLTEFGETAIPILNSLSDWGEQYILLQEPEMLSQKGSTSCTFRKKGRV